MWKRVLLHLSALLVVAALAFAAGAWLHWREVLAERRAAPRPGQVLAGMVVNIRADGVLDLHQWNGRRALVGLANLRPWGREGLVWLIDHGTRQSVEARVTRVAPDGRVEAEVSYLGRQLGVEMIRNGMAERRDPALPEDPELRHAYLMAEREAKREGRGAYGPGSAPHSWPTPRQGP